MANIFKSSRFPADFDCGDEVVRFYHDPSVVDEGWGPEDCVERAKRQAQIVVSDAKAEAESIRGVAREEGFQQGHTDGVAAGLEKARAATDGLIRRSEDLIRHIEAEMDRFVCEAEPAVLMLCLEMVEKVIRHEIRTDREVVLRAVKSCLKRLTRSSEVCIRVNPTELDLIRAQKEELLSVGVASAINVIDDRRVSPGGCIVETPDGDYDATIETQIVKLKEKALETLEHGLANSGARSPEVLPGDKRA